MRSSRSSAPTRFGVKFAGLSPANSKVSIAFACRSRTITPRLPIARVDGHVLHVARFLRPVAVGKEALDLGVGKTDQAAVRMQETGAHQRSGIADHERSVGTDHVDPGEPAEIPVVRGDVEFAEKLERPFGRAGTAQIEIVDGADGDGERFSGRALNCGEPGQRGEESERPHAARRRLGCPRTGAAGFSSNSSASFSIITPASSSASTMVTARLVVARHVVPDADGDQLDRRTVSISAIAWRRWRSR